MPGAPIVLFVFDRPESTASVFEAVARQRPEKLYVFADAPRLGAEGEAERCALVREIVSDVTWDCDAHIDFADQNMGCRQRVRSGIDLVFEESEEAIFLEDDCIPDPSFFRFCDEMLQHHRHDPSVMMICGTNYTQQWKAATQSYLYSAFGTVWGWASWRRAWDVYDPDMDAWHDDAVREAIRETIGADDLYDLQAQRFDRLASEPGDRHSWDLPWLFTRLAHAGKTVVPAVNLIDNVGNEPGRGLPDDHPLALLTAESLAFPLRPPPSEDVDRDHDRRHLRQIYDYWDDRASARATADRRRRSLPRRALRTARQVISR